MQKRLLFFCGLLILLFLLNSAAVAAQPELAMAIKDYLVVIKDHQGFFPADQEVEFYQELDKFYQERYQKPVWFDQTKFKIDVQQLVAEIKASYQEGLNPADYHLRSIEKILKEKDLFKSENLSSRALLDILLTDAYLNLASDYLTGKVDPEVVSDNYNYQDDKLQTEKLLDFLTAGCDIRQTLQKLLPQGEEYKKLRDKLAYYRNRNKIKEWPAVKTEFNLARGDSGTAVEDLINNLIARNYLDPNQLSEADYFNDQVKNSLIKFQLSNGLQADGVLGPKTKQALNVSLTDRIKQIIINLERWRWLPEKLAANYIYINIADYKLNLISANREVMTMKTIVGQEQRKTPVFSDQIKYIVFNPYWYVPKSIAVEDKLPLIKQDYSYLLEHNYKLFKYNTAGKLVEVDPALIDWTKVNRDNFNFVLRQSPGDYNALGRIKFIFPNKFSVYLHDTPGKYLFSQNKRSFSSGCIRIEKPLDLAVYLLKNQPEWNREKIEAELKQNETRRVYLNSPFPIYLQYNTAWVDQDGTLNFREDIYQRDRKIKEIYFK
ncbi:L,D-transpeptidase family protein [Halanaerobium salsuginis]|uniref:Murein L,D-transpeptidase YcbB/YkuD n=1 Tax=Halanaerobium salsuginis TaxID=29563 RepID=A0A1I4H4P4_9FIRM|nr:L,D-transpeptidase family protein [Halanaerobium salsuginis]SFL36386.1 Murein L,D-transpeptidase YcbB/YkuD [Halanaerobium salsuginis]